MRALLVAAVGLGVALGAREARAQVPSIARDLSARDPAHAVTLPPAVARTAAARRTLAALTTRLHAIEAEAPARLGVAAVLADWTAREREAVALSALAREVARSGDVALAVEALTLAGDAFERVAVQGEGIAARTPRAQVRLECGMSPAAQLHGFEPTDEERASPRAMRAWAAELRRRSAAVQRGRALEEEEGRAADHARGELSYLEGQDLESEAMAVRELAVSFFAAAFRVAFVRDALGPSAWHALDRMRADENQHGMRVMVDSVHAERWLALRRPDAPAP